MGRFTEEQIKDLIKQAEKHYRAKPSVTELTNYYNRFVLSEDDFKNHAIKIIRKGGNFATVYFSDKVEELLSYYMEYRKFFQ